MLHGTRAHPRLARHGQQGHSKVSAGPAGAHCRPQAAPRKFRGGGGCGRAGGHLPGKPALLVAAGSSLALMKMMKCHGTRCHASIPRAGCTAGPRAACAARGLARRQPAATRCQDAGRSGGALRLAAHRLRCGGRPPPAAGAPCRRPGGDLPAAPAACQRCGRPGLHAGGG